jgi:hypothetical protein
MEQLIHEFAPFVVSGLVSALVSWASIRIELRYLRRDVERLRFYSHSPENPKSYRSALQDHETRLALLERERLLRGLRHGEK